MSVPDKLVEAASAALSDETVDWVTDAGAVNTEAVSRAVLAAAFAVLPECEEAIAAAIREVAGDMDRLSQLVQPSVAVRKTFASLATQFGAKP